ncbi:hypothetical protein, partial [Streptomyces hygroscopicus]|uniref:hypothetical protein n=1 Tax=Streptomyces hygroscopicus TaxID=1912 RepID=UPI0036BA89F2
MSRKTLMAVIRSDALPVNPWTKTTGYRRAGRQAGRPRRPTARRRRWTARRRRFEAVAVAVAV